MFFECLEHGVHTCKSAFVAFAKCGLSGQHAVTLKQLHRSGMGALGWCRAWFKQRCHERPPACSGWWSGCADSAGSWSTAFGCRSLRCLRAFAAKHGTYGRKRIVGDLACPHEIPQRTQDRRVAVVGSCFGTGSYEVRPEARASLAKVPADCVVTVTLGGFICWANEERCSFSEQQSDAAVVLAYRTGPDPDQIPRSAECVEVGLAVVGHTHGQNVTLEYRCRNRRSLQDGQHIDQAIDTSARCSHSLPSR